MQAAERGAATNTLAAYRRDLEDAGAFLKAKGGELWTAPPEALRSYLASLKEIGAAYKALIGRHYPAMALVQVVALVEDRALVEIEATAVVPEGE